MRPLSYVLMDLIAAGEAVVAKPATMLPPDRAGRFAMIAAEIQRHDSLPAEDRRATRGGLSMSIAIEQHWAAMAAKDHVLAQLWLADVGLKLPIVRHEAFIAMRNEREARS